MKGRSAKIALLAGAAGILSWGVRASIRKRNRLDFQGRVVVIAGGSRGLGLVLARKLADEGARLALLARSVDELEHAEQELVERDAEVMTIPCDLRDQEQVEQAIANVVRRYGQVDILVNNAGVIQVGPVAHMKVEDFEDAMAVHFWGPLYATLAVLNYMRQQRSGRIINITSIGGEVAVPHLAPYVASKFALVGLSDALRAELAEEGIRVTTIVPGLMRTGSHVNAFFKGRHRLEYAWFSTLGALPVTSTSAESAARQIIDAIRHADPHRVITPQARLLVLANSLFPGLTAEAMKLVNHLLPKPEYGWGEVLKTGWESQSRWSPSELTQLSDEAAINNNELRGRAPLQD